MKDLARRGHQVDVVTHYPQKNPIPNLKDISLKGSVEVIVNNMTAMDIKNFGFDTLSMAKLAKIDETQICELLNHPKLRDLIENPPRDPPYNLVITEVGYSILSICAYQYSYM